MGKNNKARRAAKARAKKSSRSSGRPGQGAAGAHPFGDPGAGWVRPPGPVGAEARWRALEAAAARGDAGELEVLAERMVRDDPTTGPRVAEQLLLADVGHLWRAGWQPVELVRQIRRRVSKTAAQLIETAIHVDHARRPGQALDPRWTAQLIELGSRRVSTSPGWLLRWGSATGRGEVWAVAEVAKVLAALATLPVIDVLIPPPGAPAGVTVHGVPLDSGADDPVLRRVRKLLAKAESTTFSDEADALTGKAHELMTRHAIDQVAVHAAEPSDVPCTIRLPIDAPYADAKSFLLQVVASRHRCRSIFHPGIDLSTVIGHAGDLRAVELIFTSLLVQAQHALAAADRGAHGRTRSPSYRSAFYLAYARRIGERLQVVTDDLMAAAGDGDHLPVLRAREDAVADAFEQRYGAALSNGAVRGGWDPLGQAHGRQAADAARFGSEAITA